MQTAFLVINITQQQTLLNVNFFSVPSTLSDDVVIHLTTSCNEVSFSVVGRSFRRSDGSRFFCHFMFNLCLVFRRLVRHCRLCRSLLDEVGHDVPETTPETFWNGYGSAIVWTHLDTA